MPTGSLDLNGMNLSKLPERCSLLTKAQFFDTLKSFHAQTFVLPGSVASVHLRWLDWVF